MDRKSIMKPTSDNWCPNYPNDEVRVSQIPLTDGTFRVCVWGEDDLGMEYDYETSGEAEYMFALIEKQVVITFDFLKAHGFVGA